MVVLTNEHASCCSSVLSEPDDCKLIQIAFSTLCLHFYTKKVLTVVMIFKLIGELSEAMV